MFLHLLEISLQVCALDVQMFGGLGMSADQTGTVRLWGKQNGELRVSAKKTFVWKMELHSAFMKLFVFFSVAMLRRTSLCRGNLSLLPLRTSCRHRQHGHDPQDLVASLRRLRGNHARTQRRRDVNGLC